MVTDAYGLPITTPSRAALEAYDRGVDAALAWKAGALDRFREATTHDPALAVAHAGAAICLYVDERFAEARAASDAARAAATPAITPRERSHVHAVTLWTAGKLPEAERAMREHLCEWPRDLVIVQRLYFIFFWQGRFPEMLDATTVLVAANAESSYMLGMHAFALEEAGLCREAAALAEAALARNAEDAWSIHALAHALYESGEFDAGVQTLPRYIAPCEGLNSFSHHLWWHLALMHLARGEYESVSELSRARFEREPSPIAGDLHDAISLLWRLELAGRRPGERWKPFADIARERVTRMGLPFHVAHVAMALGASGDWPTAERQSALVRERAGKDATGVTGEVLAPLVEGLHAFAAGDYRRTIERLAPIQPRIIGLGGSRAQRDVFHDTLIEACFRAGDMDRAERLLGERLRRRPEHFWLHRRTG